MVYGNGDKHVAKYRDIEYAIKDNLDKWLCNMYIEIAPLDMKQLRVDFKKKKILLEKTQEQKLKEALGNQPIDENASVQDSVPSGLKRMNSGASSRVMKENPSRNNSSLNLLTSFK